MLALAADHEYGDLLRRLATCVPEVAELVARVDEVVGWRLIHAEARGAALISGTVDDNCGELASLLRGLGNLHGAPDIWLPAPEDDKQPTFAALLHLERLRRGFTLEELGALLGVSRSQAGQWERGSVPRRQLIPAIARFLNRDRGELEAMLDKQRGVVAWGARIRAARRSKGLTQEDLGLMCGVSAASVCCWEKGRRRPRAHVQPALMAALGVDETWLAGEGEQ